MDYKIPDFLMHPKEISREKSDKLDRQQELERKYFLAFPESHIDMHCIDEGLNPDSEGWDRFYSNIEESIRKGIPLEELYPEWDIWDPESEDEI